MLTNTAKKHPVIVPSALVTDSIKVLVTAISVKNHGNFLDEIWILWHKLTFSIFITLICSVSTCRKHLLIIESCVISHQVCERSCDPRKNCSSKMVVMYHLVSSDRRFESCSNFL